MSGTPLTDAAKRHAKEVEGVKAGAPSKFVVGGSFDGKTTTGSLTFNRTWKNGWGATAYARAWWRDASITPVNEPRSDVAVGGEVTKTFK